MPNSALNIAQQLAAIVERYHSLQEILGQAVQHVARALGADAGSIFLLQPQDMRLHLVATTGLDQAAIGKVSLALSEGLVGELVTQSKPLAVEDAAAHPAYRYFPETREERFSSFLGVPLTVRDRAIGALVIHTLKPRRFSEEEVQALDTLAAQLAGIVANVRLIEALDRGEAAELTRPPRPPKAPPGPRAMRVLTGTPASPGIAIGAAALRAAFELDPAQLSLPSRGIEAERGALQDVLTRTSSDIQRIQRAAALEADEEHALIFSSHLLLLNDPILMDRMEAAITGGASAAVAIDGALQGFAQQLGAVNDPYLQERVEDVHDLRSRLLSHLLDRGVAPRIRDRVVITTRIPPSLIVEIKAEGARGLITALGGSTAHGILLARAMRIPVVTGIDLTALALDEEPFIVDGTQGCVVINPDEETLRRYRAAAEDLERRRTGYARLRDQPARSADGVRVLLKANVSISADLANAREQGAEGVGLYRTEFPFILREHFPTRDEQIPIYRKAYEIFPDASITFRILDLGGDKFVPGGPVAGARDAFHGYRSIRVLFDHPQVLLDQVQALALAAGARPLRLLVPMVSSLEDVRRVRQLVEEALRRLGSRGALPVLTLGVMIEVPAAVEIAGDLAREVDFLSIGTNDLIQYSLVIDREDARMTAASDARHPAILRMLRRAIDAVHGAGKPVGVCGEMAADPALATLLVAMGVDELSVVPHAIPEIKQALARADIGAIAGQLGGLLALGDVDAVRAELRRLLG